VKRYGAAGLLAVGIAIAWPDLAAIHLPWAGILLALIVLDFALGVAEAAAPGGPGIQLDRLWATARKTVAYYAAVLATYLIGAYEPKAWEVIPDMYLFWSAVEGLSVLGHCMALGAPAPAWIRDLFESLRGKGEGNGTGT
jgi:phage-related holin